MNGSAQGIKPISIDIPGYSHLGAHFLTLSILSSIHSRSKRKWAELTVSMLCMLQYLRDNARA